MASSSIRSLFVVGNSYSATTQPTAYQAWAGMLSALLGFPFVQNNNQAVPGAQLLTKPTPYKPGLIAQLQRLPAGSKAGALLVIWIFPALDQPLQSSQFIPVYTSGIDIAYTQGFRMVLMPNLPDITKTALYKRSFTRVQLAALHAGFAAFNVQYNTMLGTFISRYRNTKFATVDVFTRWDGSGTVPDGLHPNQDTHRLFAGWFKLAVSNF
jgi:hypothetical protein